MRVIGYARLSPRPEEGFGIDVQCEKMRAYAELYELNLVDILVEPELVSAKTLDRECLERALAELDAGRAEGLLVAKLDRLTRNIENLGKLIRNYFGERFALFSVSEQVDTRTASGRMVINILTVISQWERETIGERTSEALQHLKSKGVKLGRPPLGWERTGEVDEEGRLVLREVPDELETVYRILELRGEGKTLREIAEIMREEDRPTKRGGRWHHATVRKILERFNEGEGE